MGKIKDYEIGDTFKCGRVKLKCVRQPENETCESCFFLKMCNLEISKMIGECSCETRDDEENIIFVEV